MKGKDGVVGPPLPNTIEVVGLLTPDLLPFPETTRSSFSQTTKNKPNDKRESFRLDPRACMVYYTVVLLST